MILHHLVATRARDVARLVRAALPEDPGPLGVTGETDLVPLIDRRRVVLRERDHAPGDFRAAGLDVRLARAMAVLAGEALLGVARLVEEETTHLGVREP